MTLPCQYCRAPVDDAERFARSGNWPCCKRCSWVPLTVGVAGLLMFGFVFVEAWRAGVL